MRWLNPLFIFPLCVFLGGSVLFSCYENRQTELNNSAVAHWDFNATSGKVLHDISGNNHDGIIISPQWVNGKNSGALAFHGGSSWVTVPFDDALQPKEELTVEAIVKFNRQVLIGGEPIISNNHGGGFGLWAWMGLMNIWINIGTDYQSVLDPDEHLTDEWYHLAGIFDGKKLSFYVNHKLKQEMDVSGEIHYSVENAIQIAREASATNVIGSSYFDGLIDEIRISNRSLTIDEFLIL